MINLSFNNFYIAQRGLSLAGNSVAKAMLRMSTGCKINSASDNAANLSLSKKIEAKNSGLEVAYNNIQSGIAKLQTYDGDLDGITNSLQRVRELTLQSLNGVYSESEKSMLNTEIQQQLKSIEMTSNQVNNEVGAGKANVGGLINNIEKMTSTDAVAAGYTLIKTAAELQAQLNANPSGKFILMNDIDMSELGVVDRAVVTSLFSGTFDGNGYTIKNLTIESNANNTGLFAQTSGANIKNVLLDNAKVTAIGARTYVGSLVGLSSGTNIENCAAINVEVNATQADYVGGLSGSNTSGSIDSCYTTGSIIGYKRTGGLTGENYINSSISSCYSTVDISGFSNVGGLVGRNHTNGSIVSSYATGSVDVSSTNNSGGGLVGNNILSSIEYCYAAGDVTGIYHTGGLVGRNSQAVISFSYATGNVLGSIEGGGLVGHNDTSAAIESSYSTGNVSGTDYIGGFVGLNDLSATITSSASSGVVSGNTDTGGFLGSIDTGIVDDTNYWNVDTSGMTASAGSATGLSNQEYQNKQEALSLSIGDVLKTGNLGIQIGDSAASFSRYEMQDLGLNYSGKLNISINTDEGARKSLQKLDEVLEYITLKRAKTGSYINLLQANCDKNYVRRENLISSLSVIKDADIAVESANLMKAKILQQASVNFLSKYKSDYSNLLLNLLS